MFSSWFNARISRASSLFIFVKSESYKRTSLDYFIVPGTKVGAPKINIIGAREFGNLKVLLPENSQIILSPAYVTQTLKQKLKDYQLSDYLLLTGDPAIIGVACSIVSDITNGKYNLLKWDKQERKYYPVEIDLYKT